MPLANRSNVAAVIPAYLEEKYVREVATQTKAWLDTVVVVDDGSKDRTRDEAAASGATVLRHETNAGKGAAIKTGINHLLGLDGIEFILVLDGDGQHLPQEIPRFLKAANDTGAAFVVGNRMGDVRTMPFVRKWTNRYMSWKISRIIGQTVPDTQCGFRMFSRTLALEFMKTECSAFDFETEMLALAAKQGCRIAAATVSTIYRDEVSKVHPIRDTVKFFKLVKRLRQRE